MRHPGPMPLLLIVGKRLAFLAYYVSYRLGGYEGALLGLALIPALVVISLLLRRMLIQTWCHPVKLSETQLG